MASLFGTNAAGTTLQDKVAQALAFAQNARGATGPVATEPVAALVDDVAPAVEAATSAPTEVVAPAVADEGMDLAAASRAAANEALADTAYLAATTQQPTIVIRPNIVVEGQAGVQEVVVDVAIPRARPNVVIAQATATVIDPAAGQAVASAGEGVATSRASGFRSWGAGDIGSLFGGGGRGATSSAATDAAGAAADVAGPARSGWREQINAAVTAARGTASSPVSVEALQTAAESVSAPAGASLLDRLRAGIPDIATLRGAGAASTVSEAAEVVRAAKPSLLSKLRDAAEVAAEVAIKANPKG